MGTIGGRADLCSLPPRCGGREMTALYFTLENRRFPLGFFNVTQITFTALNLS
jgi:hypothetical protein